MTRALGLKLQAPVPLPKLGQGPEAWRMRPRDARQASDTPPGLGFLGFLGIPGILGFESRTREVEDAGVVDEYVDWPACGLPCGRKGPHRRHQRHVQLQHLLPIEGRP
jgi:hypothetical protein